MKKGILQNIPYDLVDIKDFYENREKLKDSSVAVGIQDNERYIALPYFNNKGDKIEQPGVYNNGDIDFIVYPTNEERSNYEPSIIDFDNITSMKDYQERKSELDKVERNYLMTNEDKDNCFIPPLLENDTPEMRAVKEAIIAKHIDLDKYADRYGTNYPNDKRRYKDNSITLFLLKRTCENLDMKASLIISDKSPDVPNPIGKEIVVNLITGNDEDE